MSDIDLEEEQLSLHSELQISPFGQNSFRVSLHGDFIEISDEFFDLFMGFRTPKTINQELESHRSGFETSLQWIQARQAVEQWRESGLLVSGKEHSGPERTGFSSLKPHIEMLNDRARTGRFIKAIQAKVKKGDIVVDLGSGSGVLAVAAAMAGAERVHAIEAGGMSDVIPELAKANGVGDKVFVHRGRSQQVNLPEKADVLVTETLGHEAFGEGLVENVIDARARFLKPDARLIPENVEVVARIYEPSREWFAQYCVSGIDEETWRSDYGLDFSPLAKLGDSQFSIRQARPQEISTWRAITKEVSMIHVDLNQLKDGIIGAEQMVSIDHSSSNPVVVFSFRSGLSDEHVITTVPEEADGTNHWDNIVYLPGNGGLEQGQKVEICYSSDGKLELHHRI